MNRILYVVFVIVLLLYGAAEDVVARTIDIRESLNPAARDTISAQTVIDSIKVAGKEDRLEFNNLVIEGNLSFVAFIDTVWCVLSFKDVIFQGDATFNLAQFQGNVDFRGAQFQGDAYFSNAQFQGDANFVRAHFQGHADFWRAHFQGDTDFNEAQFQRFASFGRAQFQRFASFGRAQFQRFASFGRAQFQGDADFDGAHFQGDARFYGAHFQGDANFVRAHFQGDVNFSSVIFNLIHISWEQLDGHMFYERTNYSTFLRNFEQLNLTDDYDECYYDFRVQKRKNERKLYSPVRWLEWFFLDLTCGYGVKPFRAIIWASGLMLLFSLYYIKKGAIELRVERQKCNGVKENGESCMNNREQGTEFCQQHQNQSTWLRRFRNALYFSVGTFTTVGYGDWHPVGKYRYAAMIEGLVGWLIMALFLVTLGKVWIR